MNVRFPRLGTLALAFGVAGTALPAFAMHHGCGPMMENTGPRGERQAERMEQRQKQLHDALKLAPEQEGAWKKFADSMQPGGRKLQDTPANWRSLTAPERAEKMLDLAKRHQERMAEHVAALKEFYATLSPEQKKIFDEYHSGPRGGRRGPATGGPGPAPATK